MPARQLSFLRAEVELPVLFSPLTLSWLVLGLKGHTRNRLQSDTVPPRVPQVDITSQFLFLGHLVTENIHSNLTTRKTRLTHFTELVSEPWGPDSGSLTPR